MVKCLVKSDYYGVISESVKLTALSGKFEYEAGAKSDIFDQKLENILQPFKCDEDNFTKYIEQGVSGDMDSVYSFQRCIGIGENAALDLIDQIF